MILHKKSKWWQKKKITIPLFILILLIAVRVVLPEIILKKVNEKGKEVSPLFTLHAQDLDLGIIRAGATLENIELALKENQRKFMDIESVDVSLAWREVFKGNFLLDVEVEKFNLLVSRDLMTKARALAKEAKEEKAKAPPVKIDKISAKDSKVTLLDYPGLSGQKHLTVNDINAQVTNVTGNKKNPLSFFNFAATFVGKSDINAAGKVNLLENPKAWGVDFEFNNFDLTDANKILVNQIPVTFKQGTLDVYMEAESENNRVQGYVKPFMNDVEVIGKNENFIGGKHFLIEILGEIGTFIFEENKTESVATRVPFIYDGQFKADTGEALRKVIQHGFTQKISRGVENLYDLK